MRLSITNPKPTPMTIEPHLVGANQSKEQMNNLIFEKFNCLTNVTSSVHKHYSGSRKNLYIVPLLWGFKVIGVILFYEK